MTHRIERRIIEKKRTRIKSEVSQSLGKSETLQVRAERGSTHPTEAKTTLEHNIIRSIRPATITHADIPTRNSDGRFQLTLLSGTMRKDLPKQNPKELVS